MSEMMPPTCKDAEAFAAARTQFHRLVEFDASERELELQRLAQIDEQLEVDVRALFQRFDARDLMPQEKTVPDEIGPFRVLRLIGRGGMGEVFEGERAHADFRQKVALKLIRSGCAGALFDDRFLRERRILAKLNHPRIARLIDGGKTDSGAPWLAMEFVQGIELGEWVTRALPDLRRRLELFLRICDAVAFAHRALVVHRDIKPANVLVDADDEPKLLDFGIAKLLDDDEFAPTRTLTAGLTLRYAAPEQVLGDRTTTATDVYALGVVLFELIARRSPYRAADVADAPWREAILQGDVHPLGAALTLSLLDATDARRAARELAPVIERAMSLAPSDRYGSVSALADDLKDWLAGRPCRSGVGRWSARLWIVLRRHRLAVASAIVAISLLVVAAVIALREAAEAQRQAEVAQRHVDALLGILSAANPMHYGGRDPTASEFLVKAAAQIERDHAQSPALVFRALGEIGHGLINLGHAERAEPVLRAALDVANRDPSLAAVDKLGYLKLLALSFDGEDRNTLPQVRATADRIERLAASSGPIPMSADALASIAGRLAQLGDTQRATQLFEHAVAMQRHSEMPVETRENIWRQKGWAALRAGEAEMALADFAQMRAAIDAAPERFDAVRVAEADWLMAEAAVDAGDTQTALQRLALAEPVLMSEFSETHPERRNLALTRIAAQWQAGDTESAWLGLGRLAATAFPAADPNDQAHVDALLAGILIDLNRCDEARPLIRALVAGDAAASRQRRLNARVEKKFDAVCSGRR